MNGNRGSTISYFLLRVVAGWLFFQVGSLKLFGWYGGVPGHPGAAAPWMTEAWIGGVLETFGGLAILFGFLTRPVAFILSGEMAVAYWQFHAPRGTWLVLNHGEPAVLFCFIYLYMAARGAGEWSLDALLHRGPGSRERARTAPAPPVAHLPHASK